MRNWPLMRWELLSTASSGGSNLGLIEFLLEIPQFPKAILSAGEKIYSYYQLSMKIRGQYLAVHKYLDANRQYRVRNNLSNEEEKKLKIEGGYKV